MSFSEDTLLELMAYADDELDGEDRSRVEALLASDAEARSVVASFGIVGRLVERVEDERAFKAGADGIAAAVMAAPSLRPAALAPAPVDPIPLAPRRNVAWRWAGAGTLVALAAGYALVAGRAHDAPADAPVAVLSPVANAANANAEGPDPAANGAAVLPRLRTEDEAVAAEEGQGVDVDHIEAQSKPVSVIYVPATATPNLKASSVVVWITEDEGPGGH